MFKSITSAFKSFSDKIYEIRNSSTVSLAVSGLSKAGKTVFLTSLIANLQAACRPGAARNRMNELECVKNHRLQKVFIRSNARQQRPMFDFHRYWEAMTSSPPAWPKRTGATAEVSLVLRFGPDTVDGKATDRTADLTVRLIDYPGEWLMDLPLLGKSFAEWSASAIKLATTGKRAPLSQNFRDWLSEINPNARVDDAVARKGAELWRDYLHACRAKGLRYLQPGRFVRDDGTDEDAKPELDRPILWFFPMHEPSPKASAVKDSLRAHVEARYCNYRDSTANGFFEDAFDGVSRHVVLVDVLAALNGGREVVEDTTHALRATYDAIKQQNASLLNRLRHLRLRSGPDKVLFCATKADHLPEAQRETMADLLRKMLDDDISAAELNKVGATMAIAAVCCTTEETVERDGRILDAVVGRPVSKPGEGPAKRTRIIVQPLPGQLMSVEWWQARTAGGARPYDFPVFEPPAMPADPSAGIPHINLDRALEYLLGDLLR